MALRPLRALYAASSLVFGLAFAVGCGGGGSTPAPTPQTTQTVKVTFSSAPPSVAAGDTVSFFAFVTGSTNTGVTYQVNGTTGGNSTVGTITTTGQYTAPTTVPSPATVTVKAVAQADTTKSASTTTNITIGVSPASTSILIGSQPITFTATGASVNWSLSPAGTSFGTITSTGADTATYTPPNAIPDPPNFAVIATSQSDATVSGAAACVLNSGGASVNQASQAAPIKLGTSGGNIHDTSGNFCCSGTLGSLLTRGGTQYLLSNNHVLAKSDKGVVGDPVSQPGLVDTNCAPGQTVATLTQFVKLENGTGTGTPPTYTGIADAAMAQVSSGKVDPTGSILQLGTVSGGLAQPAPPSATLGTPTVGMQVAKSGRTTGLTCSTVTAVNLQVQIDYSPSCGSNATAFTLIYNNQIDIFSTSFSAAGDSGSLIVDATTARPVALLYGGSPTDTVANPIADVLKGLADSKGVQPTFVGGADHTVSACTGNGSPSGQGEGLSAATTIRIADDEMVRASAAKATYAHSLMSEPGVLGVGVTAGDTPGTAAVLVLLEKGKPHGPIPATLNGVPTKTRTVQRFRAFMSCPTPEKSSWHLPRDIR